MNPLAATQLSEHELAWIGAGMAAGHLTQARNPVPPRKPYRGKRPSLATVRLEHMHAACEWLIFSARYKILGAV